MTVDGVEIDLKSYMDHWQKCVEEDVAEKAKELLKEMSLEKVYDITEKLQTLEGLIDDQIEEANKKYWDNIKKKS